MTETDDVLATVMRSVARITNEFREDNDRAVIIIGAINIDNLLRRLIEQSLLPKRCKQEDELFDGESPLSTFSSKIDLCYRIGLIDKGFASSLHLLRKIRNDCAHKIECCDLNSSPNSDRVSELVKPLVSSLTFEHLRQLVPYNDLTSRSVDFRVMLSLICSVLEMKTHYLPKETKLNPASMSWIPTDITL
jgi:hypothetical protein